jgi:hypothetical protein
MFGQFLVGSTVSLCNIVIHALVMTAVVRVVHTAATRHRLLPTLHMIVVMVATVSVLMAAHASEVIVWSLAYVIIDAAPAGGALAADWTDNGNEWHARVRLVDRCYFRGAATDNDT